MEITGEIIEKILRVIPFLGQEQNGEKKSLQKMGPVTKVLHEKRNGQLMCTIIGILHH